MVRVEGSLLVLGASVLRADQVSVVLVLRELVGWALVSAVQVVRLGEALRGLRARHLVLAIVGLLVLRVSMVVLVRQVFVARLLVELF